MMAPPLPHSACLCWALYHPKIHNNNKDGTMIRQSNKGILWPALRFSTISDFLSVKGGSFDASTSSNDTNIISFLGRPVDEYVNADESEMKDMKVQGYINGLASFTKRRKCPDFTQQFISLCASSCGDSDSDDGNDDGDDDDDDDDDDNRGEATTAAAFDLFQDFYKALDIMVAIYDDDMDDSDDDDDDDNDDVAWASKAQQDWDGDQSLGGSVVAVSSTSKVQHDWDEYQSLGGDDGNDRDNGNWIGKVVVVSSMSSLSSQNDYTSLCIDQPSYEFASSNIRKRKHSNRDSTSTSNKTIMEDTSVPKDGNSTASSSSSSSNNNNNDDDSNNNNGNKRQCTVSDRDVIPIAINVTNTNSNGSNNNSSNSNSKRKRKRKRKRSSMGPLARTEKEKRESQSPSIQRRLRRSSSSSSPSVPTNRNKNTPTSIRRDCLSVASKSSMSVSLSQDGVVPVDVMCGTRNEKGKSGSNESNYPSSSSGTANASRPPRFPTPSPRL